MQKEGLNFLDFFKKDSSSGFDIQFFLNVISHKSNNYYYYGDLEKKTFYVSNNMCERFGFANNIVPDFVNKWAELVYSKQDRDFLMKDLTDTMERKKKVHNLRYRIRDVYGNVIWIRCYGEVKFSPDGKKPLYFVGYVTQQDDYLLVDPVTNFPMDKYLVEYLKEHQENGQEDIGIGVCFNHIGEINSKLGRDYADRMLKQVCYQLNNILNIKVKFFRLDGPRIMAILDESFEKDIDNIVYLIKKATKLVYEENNIMVNNPCSFSVLKNTMDSNAFIENVIFLLRKARQMPDQMYVDGNIHCNDVMDVDKNKELSEMILQINKDVLNNMENFRIVIQPVVDVNTEKVVGGETLLRWKYKGVDQSPGFFIDILEKQNLIQKVGSWVFEQAVQMCKMICRKDPEFYLSVNVSWLQLKDKNFVDYIMEILYKYQLSGNNIVVEMTESSMEQDPEAAEAFINQCSDLGIKFALDDFGTGYSSVQVLLKYPMEIIKIDRSLMLEMQNSSEKKVFVATLIHACKSLNKKVIVEGIETENQRDVVRESKCDVIQGYYYYRPQEKTFIRDMYQIIGI